MVILFRWLVSSLGGGLALFLDEGGLLRCDQSRAPSFGRPACAVPVMATAGWLAAWFADRFARNRPANRDSAKLWAARPTRSFWGLLKGHRGTQAGTHENHTVGPDWSVPAGSPEPMGGTHHAPPKWGNKWGNKSRKEGKAHILCGLQNAKARRRAGLSSTHERDQALTRALYSPVRVSISMESPISQKADTCSSEPLFRRAVFITLPEVSPRTDGSV